VEEDFREAVLDGLIRGNECWVSRLEEKAQASPPWWWRLK